MVWYGMVSGLEMLGLSMNEKNSRWLWRVVNKMIKSLSAHRSNIMQSDDMRIIRQRGVVWGETRILRNGIISEEDVRRTFDYKVR